MILSVKRPTATVSEKSEHVASRSLLKKTRGRIIAVVFCMLCAYTAVCVKLVNLSLNREPTETRRIVALNGKKNPLQGRADITDRNGKILAGTLNTASLYADPKIIIDPVEAAQKLSAVFPDLNYGRLLKDFQSDKRFIWIKRNLTPEQEYRVNRLGLPGINFTQEQTRIYPNGQLASHVIGYTDVDNLGVMGIEKSFDNMLSEDKREIALTVDTRVQYVLENELRNTVKEFSASGAAGIVMNAVTGEIIAMASLPDFNPNRPKKSPLANQYNRTTMGSYEMGSTFKIFTTAAHLETGRGSIRDTFDATKPLKVGGFSINDYHAEKRLLSVPEIFIHSSNIGTAYMADGLGTPAITEFYRKLGFFDRVSVELNEIGKPLIPSPWRYINTLTSSYGHGIAVSPLQLVTAVAGIANGGYLPQPTLIKRPDTETLLDGRKKIISEKTSKALNALMRLVVSDGTGSKANIPGFLIGGKTGTAEKILGRGYSKNSVLSSFVGVFPVDKPEYVVFVMIDEPKGTKKTYGYATAGWTAAPAAGRIIERSAPYLNFERRHDIITAGINEMMGLNQKGRRLASY